MDLKEITGQALDLVQGEERRLRLRRRRARFGLAAAVLGLGIQFVVSSVKLGDIGNFASDLLRFRFGHLFSNGMPLPRLMGALVVLAGLATYALLRWTGLLTRESGEAFRYTFQVRPFARVKDTPGTRFSLANEDRFELLAHDLMEALNRRIGRFSLLAPDDAAKDGPPSSEEDSAYAAHISIGGHYAIRDLPDGGWEIQVMPQVQIGSARQPATLTRRVDYRLPKSATAGFALRAGDYDCILERVYSSIATEVYRQLEGDVATKMSLFPTRHLRAVALACEADDFARSNTVDAYDRAIGLYKKALRYFDVGRWPVTHRLARWPVLWRKEIKFVHVLARVKIGYARVLVYRYRLSGLSGLDHRSLYEILPMLESVVSSLQALQGRFVRAPAYSSRQATLGFLTFPEDSWSRRMRWRPRADLFALHRRLLFDANVVAALAGFYLSALRPAKRSLAAACAVAPDLAAGDALYCLTKAEIEPSPEEGILLSQRAIMLEPTSQIANYLFAYKLEMRLRDSEGLTPELARPVIEAYDRVISINPGNVAAITAKGYLKWLLGSNDEAKSAFEAGRDLKEVNQNTFLGESCYGLARLCAEAGQFSACCEHYLEAIREDPRIAAYTVAFETNSRVRASYYYYIAPGILERYRSYRDGVLSKLKKGRCSSTTRDVVESFVQNDFGNACLNYYLRFGQPRVMGEALYAYRAATQKNPRSAIAFYNLAMAQTIAEGGTPRPPARAQITENLARAEKAAPHWSFLLMAAANAYIDPLGGRLSTESANEVVRRLKQVLERTRFGPLLEGTLIDYEGGGVDSVITDHLGPDRIEKTDIDTLMLWANALATNRRAVGAVRRLCDFLAAFCPDNYQLLRTMAKVESEKGARCREEDEAAEIEKAWDEWYLVADPNNFTVQCVADYHKRMGNRQPIDGVTSAG